LSSLQPYIKEWPTYVDEDGNTQYVSYESDGENFVVASSYAEGKYVYYNSEIGETSTCDATSSLTACNGFDPDYEGGTDPIDEEDCEETKTCEEIDPGGGGGGLPIDDGENQCETKGIGCGEIGLPPID
jgi:hypothetical protein